MVLEILNFEEKNIILNIIINKKKLTDLDDAKHGNLFMKYPMRIFFGNFEKKK
jgi:hypothetical protein